MHIQETRQKLLALLKRPKFAPLRKRALAKELRISEADYNQFRKLLDEMVRQSELVELKHGRYGLPGGKPKHAPDRAHEQPGLAPKAPPAEGALATGTPWQTLPPEVKSELPKHARTGRIDIKRGGMGFLLSDPPGNDIFIGAEDLGGALSGDWVAVEMKRRKIEGRRRSGWGGASGSRPAGRVLRVLQRAHPRIIGTFYSHSRSDDPPHGVPGHVVPDTRGMFNELDILPADTGLARDRDKVAVELVEPDERQRSGSFPTARVVQVFGPAGTADADIQAIIANYNIQTQIPAEVLAAAEALSEEISGEELAQRTGYEHPVTFTIDPEDAKDHDDAVAIRRESDGRFTLLVHIADVSHYVREDSVIDLEARTRATSVYLPGTVYPMLPPKLSTNLCSLKEGKLRLTKTVAMTFGPNLTMQNVKIERSYIRSAAFLTYEQVKEAIEGERPELVRGREIFETLQTMKEFAGALRAKRLATGSLDLELPEARLLLDEKLEVKGWAKIEHHWAHALIEDMMLAANRAVAEYLVQHELPGLFRIHEDPDPEALKRFADFVREFGIALRPPLDRLKLKSVLDRVEGKEYAHSIHLALLTSLKQARYSAECQPHFALNFGRYLHFTSPIRRYPDLLVHRALDTRFEPGAAALPAQGKKRPGGEKGEAHFSRVALMRSLAAHCSLKEREADAAEKDVVKFKQMQFLRRNIKESHPGVITGVRDFGLFVELQDCYIEGLVHVQDMADDYYEYFENQHLLQGRRRHRSFRLGDKVSVRVLNIDLGRKQTDLELV